ncbi:hypothetical protein ACF3DV_18300 [Chlorogloeopsis fritschii PCC 9212]|uniref:Uncharacterized protein n=1 Tax=Chlorogloeopsis fritschii PCC 6912 TaxID=211165 RepID=A0A433NHL2_CHLFR|nr:hypothetical protein [Chlorogloeopsis fritschii]MBF2008277.1 hypothetical protein [Chlorogloeopsis fritschii C42_A2020_084]RUR81873.1 hypothetical protein PCC6912_27420 [Chlorogloeopsis fritschii PCC 6912]
MFILLSRVLLWLLLIAILVTLFQRFYPSGTFVGRLLLVVLFLIILLSFINPNEPAVASLWRVVSFPLKPLGASLLLLILAAQKIKAGAIDKPGGIYLAWALTIMLLASTPAVAYFLVRSPVATASNLNQALTSTLSPTLVAFKQDSTVASVSDVGSSILSPTAVSPYLLQTPNDIPRRGLRLEDFVPNAETLSLTTRVWESYLNQVYFFLRGRQP